MGKEGDQIKKEQQKIDKFDDKVDKKVALEGKEYADIVIKKVDDVVGKIDSNFGIKEQAVIDSPRFKEVRNRALSDTFKILQEIDKKNIGEITVKLETKLNDILKEFTPFTEEEKKITKFKSDLTEFNTYMEKRREYEKNGKFSDAEKLTKEYQSKHVASTEQASPLESANFQAEKKYQEVKNTLGDAEKIAEILKIAQGYIDQSNQERKFEQQEGFRVGFILQGPNISGNGDAVNLPGELMKITDGGEESPIADLASIVEIDPTKGVRIVMLPQAMEGTKETLKQFGVTEGWVKPDVLRKAISAIKMKFSHCEEGMTRCVTPKIEGKSLETAAKAQDLVEESNAIKAKMELMKLMEQTTITSERAIKSLWFSIECKNGKPAFTPKFLADFDTEVLANKKSGIRLAQESLLKATIIEATEKADPVSKEFYLGQEALSNGKLPEARFRLTKFLYESSVKKDQPEFKEMIKFAEEKVRVFNIASIKRLQKINDQLSDSKRYQSLLKDPANERFLYKFTQQNKANLEAQLQQSEAGTIDTKSQYQALIQRREQTISATPISSVAAYGGIERGADKDNSDQLRDAWNSLVYAEFSTGVESDSSKIQDEYLRAARTLRELGQTDISSEYFEAAMKDDIEQVRGTISEAQKEQMRAKIIEENEKKRPDYEAKIRQKMFSKIEEFNAKRPAELQKPLEISAADLKALVDEAMAEGVEEQIKKVVMHGMEIANNKGLLEKGSKKAWGEYESMMDVNDKWYIISDKGAEKIAEQVFVNGVIMALSGGVGALASASVRAFMIANGVRSGFALGAAGFVSESVGFELANRSIHSTILGEKGLFMPADLAKGIGQSMLMFGAIGGGNKLWGAVSEASGLVSKEAMAGAGTAERLLRQGANYTGQLATESAVFTATSDNSFIESAGDILMLRVGGKLVSPITGAMHETSQKIIEKGLGIVKEQEKEAVVSKEVTPEISTIDPDLQKKFDRRQETRQPEIQRIKEYWEEITEHSNITNSKDTETPEAHKAQSEMISFLREEINLGMPPNLEAMWEQVRKTPLTPEQRSMTLATIQHMLRTKNQTEMIMDEMEIMALRRLGVAPGERPQRGDTKPLEDMRKQVFMEKLAEKMHLAPFKGNIDYKEIDGVFVLRCENNEDFARIANIHPGHTPAGVALTPAENGLGISLIVIRSDQELNENRSGVIRHELQHIFKQGSNNIEEGRLNYNNYSSTFQNGRSYFDEHGNLSKERVQEYLNVEKEDMHVSFKDEALAFLRTSHHQGLDNMINGLHFSENNSYDYFNGMREVILKNITKARPELMGDAEFIKGLNATIDKYRAEYRAETKEWLDGIESAVRALQDSGMAEMQARDHLADLLMFVQLKEWGKKLSEIGGKVKIENDVHSEFLNNIKIKNRWPYNEPSSGHDFETEVGAPFRAKIEELESLREKAKDLPQSYRNKVDAYVDERIKAIKGLVQMADSKRVIDGTLKLRPVSVDSFVTLNRNVSALRDKTSKLPIKIREYLEKELALSEKSILSKTEVNKDPDLVWLENDGLLIDRAVSDPALFSYALDRIGDYRVNIKLLDLLGKHKMNSEDVASTINDAEQRNLILEKYTEFKSNAVIGLNSDIKAFKEIDIKLKAAKTTEEAERLLEYSYAEVIKSAYERATAHFKLVARFDSEIMPGVSARDASEVKRLYAEIVIENYFNQDKKLISCDEFKARLSSYEKVVSNIGKLDVFEGGEQRKLSAQNSSESLENFIMEEVVENGVKAEEVEASILAEYEKVKQSASVTINVNETRIEGIYKDGEYKVYSELENKEREESLFGKTDYLSRRVAMDQKIADGQRFVVGCLASENGHDEVIGPAPFYGHGVITLKPESIDGRVVFFEGDSMTAKDIVDVTKFMGRPIKIVPQWLLRKWDNLSSRKLDFESAIFSKALMESYLKRRDLTHMHLMYVEAHVLAPVKVEDFKSVKYGLVGKDTADKQIRLQALGEKMQQIRPTAPRLEVKEFKGTIKAADKLPTYGEGHEVKKLSNDKGF